VLGERLSICKKKQKERSNTTGVKKKGLKRKNHVIPCRQESSRGKKNKPISFG